MNHSRPIAVSAGIASESGLNSHILKFEDVHRTYDRSERGVRGASLHVEAGEIVALLGPSGCGKTTALRLAAGLEVPESGKIWLEGRPVASAGFSVPPEDRGVGLIFQDFALFPHLTVSDNVLFGTHKTLEDKAYALELLQRLGMSEYSRAYPHILSGGQQQRVAIARAMAPRPRMLLLDEPFSGLDARLRDDVKDQTLHLLKESQTAAILVTHDAEEAMYLADRIVVMNKGLVEQDDTPENIYRKPSSAFVARFFGEVNHVAGDVQKGCIQTPLGTFEAAEFPDGTPVDVLIRPEGLALSSDPSSQVIATITSKRVLGWQTLLHMDVFQDPSDTDPIHIHARVDGRIDATLGQCVPIKIAAHAVHIFQRMM